MLKVMDYTIKYSKTGVPVPVVNGVHLHSIYNPEKEAEIFVEKNLNIINEKNQLLILGLGFGHHLQQIFKYIENNKVIKEIIIIEPNQEVFRDYLKLNFYPQNKVTDGAKTHMNLTANTSIFSGYEIEELYSDFPFIQFLAKRPGVLSHPVSLTLYQDYFKKFLSYKAPSDIQSIKNECRHEFIQQGLAFYDGNDQWENLIKGLSFSNSDTLKFESFLKIFDAIE